MNLVVLIAIRSGMPTLITEHLRDLKPWKIVTVEGVSDVALARNCALTRAEQFLPEADAVVMIDDDMDCSPASRNIGHLAQQAMTTGIAHSALYIDAHGMPAANYAGNGLWWTGLGCIAIPPARLIELKEASELCEGKDPVRAYTQCGPGNWGGVTRWLSEDYWLCRRLGGVVLDANVRVGHCKRVPLYPSEQTTDWVKQQK